MKKLSVILLLVLALSLGLAACNQAAATAIVARWYEDEHYEFNVTKANLDTVGVDGYAKEYTVRGETALDQMDEKVPEDVRGTYVMDIKLQDNADADKTVLYTTEMEILCLYKKDYFDSLPEDVRKVLRDEQLVVEDADVKAIFGDDADGVAVKSTTTTSVTFTYDKAQRPIHSEKEYNGYYFGKTNQEASKSKIVVDYKLEDSKVSVSVDGGKAEEKDISYNKNANIIDANQILLYIRSLEKTENSFQDAPSVQVYDPVYNVVRKASFSMNYTCQTFIKYPQAAASEGEASDEASATVPTELKAKLTCVAAVVDGQVFMVQMNLPASINKDNAKLDIVQNESKDYNKYTTVRFRVGYNSFELTNYDELKDANGNLVGAKVVDALKAAVA